MPGRGFMLTMGWLLLAPPVLAGDHADNNSAHLHSDASFNAAVEAVRTKNYQKAVLIFEAHANAMQPDAQYNLAVLLKSGKGRPQDFRQALVWSWLAQLGEVEQAEELARDLLDMLQEDSIEEARTRVLARIQQGIDNGDRDAVLKMARYQQQIVDETDPGQIYVWYAVAAALDIEGAAEARDEALDDIDDDQIVTLQEEARSLFDTFVKQEQG